jgi:hypothetical protein
MFPDYVFPSQHPFGQAQGPDTVVITRKEWEHYQQLKQRMIEYDIATGQPHCEKPDVTIWEQSIQSLIKD